MDTKDYEYFIKKYMNGVYDKILGLRKSNAKNPAPGDPINWEEGKSKVAKVMPFVTKKSDDFEIPVYVELSYNEVLKLNEIINKGPSELVELNRIRAYFASENINGKNRLTLVFVPVKPVPVTGQKARYTEESGKDVYNLGVPCPPDCATGRIKSDTGIVEGCLMAIEAYKNDLPQCLLRVPGGIADCRS